MIEGFYKIMLASIRVTIPLTILGFSFAMVIAMLKDTSLVAEITVADMFMAAQKIVGRTYELLWLYCEVALIYLIFSTVLTFVQRYFEKRLSAYNSRSTEAAAVK